MQPVPQEIIDLVEQNKVILSLKAQDQLDSGRFDVRDLKRSILNGHVVKKERDETKQAQFKYTIIGPAVSGAILYSCGKIVRLHRKVYLVITFHEVR